MYSEDSDLVMDQEFSAFSEKNVRLGKWPKNPLYVTLY